MVLKFLQTLGSLQQGADLSLFFLQCWDGTRVHLGKLFASQILPQPTGGCWCGGVMAICFCRTLRAQRILLVPLSPKRKERKELHGLQNISFGVKQYSRARWQTKILESNQTPTVILILRISIPSRVALTCWSEFACLESDTEIIRMKKHCFILNIPIFFSTFYAESVKYAALCPSPHLSIHQFILVAGSR